MSRYGPVNGTTSDSERTAPTGGRTASGFWIFGILGLGALIAIVIVSGVTKGDVDELKMNVDDLRDDVLDLGNDIVDINEDLEEIDEKIDLLNVPVDPPPRPLSVDVVKKVIEGVYGDEDPRTIKLSNTWTSHGRDIYNSRSAFNSKLTRSVVIDPLVFPTEPTCDFNIGGSVSATPAFENEVDVYFPAWNGKVQKWSVVECTLIWEIDIYADVYGSNPSLTFNSTLVTSRTTPNIWKDYIIIGIQKPADLVILNKYDGTLVKRINLNHHRHAVVTTSGTIAHDWLFVGTASLEEAAAANPAYQCCSAYGTMSGIDLDMLINSPDITSATWTTPMIPIDMVGPGKFAGAGVWGSSPAVDERTGTVYIATGNLYATPSYYQDCVEDELNAAEAEGRPAAIEMTCNRPYMYNVYAESIVALDVWTGGVKDFLRTDAYDAWNVACRLNGPNCPALSGPDADYGMTPMLDYIIKCGICDLNTDQRYLPHTALTEETSTTVRGYCRDTTLGRLVPTYACPLNPYDLTTQLNKRKRSEYEEPILPTLQRQLDPRAIPMLYVGQKSGMMHAIAVDNGKMEEVWINQFCPGGALAGIHWGAAYDEKRIYAQCTNNERKPWELPNGTITGCSGVQSYDKWTGVRDWATVNPACFDPTGSIDNPLPGANGRGYTTASSGPVSLGKGLVFVTSGDTIVTPSWPSTTPVPGHGGWLYIMDTETGEIIWRYETGRSIYGGFSVGERCVYVGIGYRNLGALGPWSTGTSVLAFCASV